MGIGTGGNGRTTTASQGTATTAGGGALRPSGLLSSQLREHGAFWVKAKHAMLTSQALPSLASENGPTMVSHGHGDRIAHANCGTSAFVRGSL
jgi:hypothetical protein